MTATSLPELLADLAAAPRLPGASCRGRAELFDRTVWQRGSQKDTQEARTAAAALCEQCPALERCRAWLDSLPTEQRPLAVTARQQISLKDPNAAAAEAKRSHKRGLADTIATLRESGLSYNAIAAATGVSEFTVRKRLNERTTTA